MDQEWGERDIKTELLSSSCLLLLFVLSLQRVEGDFF